jgi:hypothetical protein
VSKLSTLGFTRWSCALFLIVLGSRLMVFSYAGSPLPYYDQWFAEFNATLLAISAGNGIEVLLSHHNEHILLTTKVLTLLGYSINGYWDVAFVVLCSAAVRALTAAWTFQLIAESARPKLKSLLWCLCVVLFAAPFSGFNLLMGMQVSFYLVDFALLWSLRTTTQWTTPFAGGLALVGGTLFGLLSFASAVAIPACTLAAHLFQRRPRPGFWPAWTVSAVLALAFIISRRQISETIASTHAPITHQAMAHFWLQIIAWPINLAPIGALIVVLCIIALIIAWRQDRCRNAAHAIILGIGVYAAMNAAFIAMSRMPSEWHMRHWETNAFLPLALVALGLCLADLNASKRPVLILTGAIALCYAFYAGNLIRTVNWPYIQAAHDTRSAALDHYRTLLREKSLHEESSRLVAKEGYAFFDDPVGRYTIPPVVLNNLAVLDYRPLSLLSPEIIPIRSPGWFSRWTGALIACGWLITLLGAAVGVAAARRDFSRPSPPERT